jgi:hypothetical protein
MILHPINPIQLNCELVTEHTHHSLTHSRARAMSPHTTAHGPSTTCMCWCAEDDFGRLTADQKAALRGSSKAMAELGDVECKVSVSHGATLISNPHGSRFNSRHRLKCSIRLSRLAK